MREIKFRAWDSITRCYLKLDGILADGRSFLNGPAKGGFMAYNIQDFQVEQFTGLKDKHGREIYEGDICNCPDTDVDGTIVFLNGRFVWTDGACHWDMVYNAKDGQPIDRVVQEADDLVIIGNIHENPELLK